MKLAFTTLALTALTLAGPLKGKAWCTFYTDECHTESHRVHFDVENPGVFTGNGAVAIYCDIGFRSRDRVYTTLIACADEECKVEEGRLDIMTDDWACRAVVMSSNYYRFDGLHVDREGIHG